MKFLIGNKLKKTLKRICLRKSTDSPQIAESEISDCDSQAQRTILSAKDFERATGIKIVRADDKNESFYLSLPPFANKIDDEIDCNKAALGKHARDPSGSSAGENEYTLMFTLKKSQLKGPGFFKDAYKSPPASSYGSLERVDSRSFNDQPGENARNISSNNFAQIGQSSPFRKGHMRSASTPGFSQFLAASEKSTLDGTSNSSPPLTPIKAVKKGRFIVYQQQINGNVKQFSASAPVSEEEDEGESPPNLSPVVSANPSETRKGKFSVGLYQPASTPTHKQRHSICFQSSLPNNLWLQSGLNHAAEYATPPASSTSPRLPHILVPVANLKPQQSPNMAANYHAVPVPGILMKKADKNTVQSPQLRFPSEPTDNSIQKEALQQPNSKHRRQRSRFTILSEEESKKHIVDAFQTMRPVWTPQNL